MKPFTIAEYQKDPSKLSSSLHPRSFAHAKHEVISGNRLLVEWACGPEIYTEARAAKHFELRTQYRELKFRPWKTSEGLIFFCPERSYNLVDKWRWVGPEQTILIED